jgi:cytochrome b6-f complex iron-sulfur subunit
MTLLAKTSTATWILIAIAGLMLKMRTAKGQHRPLIGKPPQVTRRAFFRKAMLMGFGVAMLDFAAASLAFLWPVNKGGFGGKIVLAQSAADIKAQIASTKAPFYFAPGRFYLVEYPTTDPKNQYVVDGVAAEGLMPLYQRCVHLGCRVPFCSTSQWFECPCHGSKYSRAGEYKLGPAPRGLDRFTITVAGGIVTIDTGNLHLGPPRGTDTTGQNPEGAFCIQPSGSSKH